MELTALRVAIQDVVIPIILGSKHLSHLGRRRVLSRHVGSPGGGKEMNGHALRATPQGQELVAVETGSTRSCAQRSTGNGDLGRGSVCRLQNSSTNKTAGRENPLYGSRWWTRTLAIRPSVSSSLTSTWSPRT